MPADRRPPPDAGDLADQPLARVILALWLRGFSGHLRLSRGSLEQRFAWRAGALMGSESNDRDDALGERLLRARRITPEQLERLAAHREKRGVPEATALIALKLVEPKDLVRTIREQTARRLVDAFGWAQGSYRVEPGDGPGGETEAFRIDPLQVLQDGLAAYWRPDRILSDLEDRLGCHAVPTERFEALAARLHPGPDTDAIVRGMDPQRTFGETAATSLAPARLAVAWILAESGALDFSDEPPAAETVGCGADESGTDAEGETPRASGADAATEIEFEIEVREAGAGIAAEHAGGDDPLLELPSAEAEALRKDLTALHERLDEIDHYEVLGLPRDASASAVKKAYFAAARRFHPDAVARVGLVSLRREANELFARIAQAYQTLSSPDRRKAYDQRSPGGAAPANHANRVAQAETLFRKGEVLVKVGNYKGALDFLRPCVELWPEEADYQALLGWALYKARPSRPELAREHLEKADALRGDDPLILFRLGMVLRQLGEQEAGQIYLDRSKSLEKQARR